MTYTIEWVENGCVIAVRGEATNGDVEALVVELGGSPQLDQLHFVLHDLRQVTQASIDTELIDMSAYTNAAVSSYTRRVREAFVLGNGLMARYVRHYIEQSREAGSQWEFGVFATMDEACRWVGRPASDRSAHLTRDE